TRTCSARKTLKLSCEPSRTPPVPAVERGAVAGIPGLAKSRCAEIPIWPNLARDGPQVLAEFLNRGPAPEPIPVVDAVDDESRLEHESERDHRVVFRVGVFLDVEILLDCTLGVGQEGRVGAEGRTELQDRV